MLSKEEMKNLFKRLFPICRSITGNGLKETIEIIGEYVNLLYGHKVPSGTEVFDWTIPDEWNIRDAYIEHDGYKIVDFKKNNLHIMNYSEPINGYFSFDKLFGHLYIGKGKGVIPYKTSYYKRDWAFCITSKQYDEIYMRRKKGNFKVVIDSDLKSGNLYYGEAIINGSSAKEFLFSTYCCHPSMANNELSGPILSILVYKYLKSLGNLNYSYRFSFAPETIGTLAYLHDFERWKSFKKNLIGGLVLTQCASPEKIQYKESKEKDSIVNRIFRNLDIQRYNTRAFSPVGSEERQYNSPKFNFPVGVLSREVNCNYKEYHTSLDNLEFINIEKLLEVFELVKDFIYVLENNKTYINVKGYGEPQLSKYDLYDDLSQEGIEAIVWILNCSDGMTDLLSISNSSGIKFKTIVHYAGILEHKGVLK